MRMRVILEEALLSDIHVIELLHANCFKFVLT